MFETHNKMMLDKGYSWDKLRTIYIGGGTPSLWGQRGADFIKDNLNKFGITYDLNDIEFTLEVNPGSWNEEAVDAWSSIGVNRFSVGLQSLDQDYIKALDRVHSLDDAMSTLKFFNENDYNFSVDFMLGLPELPGSSKRNIIKELDEIMSYDPNHISLYILTTKKNYIHKELLPADEMISKEYMDVSEYFKKRNWCHYEVSNYSKPGFESKHNLNYWKCRSVAAVGPSGVGFLAEDNFRYKWKVTDDSFVSEQLNTEEAFLEKVYMSLRVNSGLSLNTFEDTEKFKNICEKWIENGHAFISDNSVILTSKGFLFIDSLMGDIFKEKMIL
jgi:oxygen-independent coproporphyrinogen-3 oxidase